jgi:hypothetical protein
MSETHSSKLELIGQLDRALTALEAGEKDLDQALEAFKVATAELEAMKRRQHVLEESLARAKAVAATAHEQLFAERAWVVEQVALIEASQSWRLGHWLVRSLRRFARRPGGSSDALSVVVRQLADRGQGSPADR